MLPAGVRFTDGTDRLACLSLSPKGLLRCTRAAAARRLRIPRGIRSCPTWGSWDIACKTIHALAAIGPARIALNEKSARGQVSSTPLRTFVGVMRIMGGVLVARLRGRYRDNAFFIADPPRPIVEPKVLRLAERTAATER